MKLKNNQEGIAHIAVIVVVLVTVVIGVVGWKVWDNNNNQDNKSKNTSTQTKSSTPETKTSDADEKATDNNFDCNGEFSLTSPTDWFAFQLDNGSGVKTCNVANVEASKLPPVGNLAGENISFAFNTYPDTTSSLETWSDDYFKGTQEDYPVTVVSKETIKLNNGQPALLVRGDGGHYDKKDYFFIYKKNNLIIFTSWDSTSKLSDRAKEVVKTIN